MFVARIQLIDERRGALKPFSPVRPPKTNVSPYRCCEAQHRYIFLKLKRYRVPVDRSDFSAKAPVITAYSLDVY